MKNLFIILCFYYGFSLFGEETIIDSVMANYELTGTITYLGDSHELIANYPSLFLYAGDFTLLDGNYNPCEFNTVSRGFVTFDLPEIPEG